MKTKIQIVYKCFPVLPSKASCLQNLLNNIYRTHLSKIRPSIMILTLSCTLFGLKSGPDVRQIFKLVIRIKQLHIVSLYLAARWISLHTIVHLSKSNADTKLRHWSFEPVKGIVFFISFLTYLVFNL